MTKKQKSTCPRLDASIMLPKPTVPTYLPTCLPTLCGTNCRPTPHLESHLLRLRRGP